MRLIPRSGSRAARFREAIISSDFSWAARHLLHRGMSRWTVFTLWPAASSRFFISSAINTERCCPPVHPNATVR